MELNEFIENFCEQLDETDPAEISAGTVFKELEEWSSMTALSVIAMIDDEYGVQVKGADIRDSRTVEDLFCRVKSLVK
jgi:acyl carrier protein